MSPEDLHAKSRLAIMEDGLVDLSLFTVPPTNDTHFTNSKSPTHRSLFHTSTWPPRRSQAGAKPLRAPRRRFLELCQDPRGDSRCILQRMKRIRIDPALAGQSAYMTTQAQQHQQTLQERRNPPSGPTLTLHSATDSPTPNRQTLPMIWLPDEQIWLVADPTDPTYGYYAPLSEEDEAPPAYAESESPASDPSPSDFSPVRSQFMTLIEHRRQVNYPEDRLSPLFQEAIHGVDMLEHDDSNESSKDHDEKSLRRLVSGPSRKQSRRERRDSWHTDSGVSPISPGEGSRWRVQRASSARH